MAKTCMQQPCVAKQEENHTSTLGAVVLTQSVCSPGDGAMRAQSGAVAAAARELRPVEIVGLYEEQKDRMEVTSAARIQCQLKLLTFCQS